MGPLVTPQVQLSLCIPPESLRIAHLRGRIRASVVVRTDKLQIEPLPPGQDLPGKVVGMNCSVNLKLDEGCLATVTLLRADMDEAHWNSIGGRLASTRQGFQLFDSDGHQWLEASCAPEMVRSPTRKVFVTFVPSPGFEPTSPPKKLVWIVPTQAAEEWIPFEFEDLPLRPGR
jgi:hypothetical protein